MEFVAAIGGLSFILASLIVGARLIARSLQTRKLPEFLMGAGLFLMGGVGYPLMIAGQLDTGLSDTARAALVAANMLCTVVGHGCLAVFTQRVFRHDSRPAQMAVGILIACLAGGFVYQGVIRDFLIVANGDPLLMPFQFIGIVNLLWAAVESALYYQQMKRRMRIGLAEPLLVDRFRLWALAIGCAAVTAGVAVAFQLAGVNIAVSALGASVIAPLGLTTATALWFAFWPPQRYARRFRSPTT